MTHWYAGWKFWPERTQGPVGADYRQVSWIRPYRPGPPRVILALFGVLITTLPTFLSLSILLGAGPVVPRLVYATAFGLLATGLAIGIARFFAVGVYVNDAGVRILTMRSMAVYPWRLIADVSTSPTRGDPDAEGDRVVITVRDLGPIATPVRRHNMDFVGRPETFSMAALAIERWWRDAGAMGRGER